MVSHFALFSNLLLASAALAVHSSSPVGTPLTPSHETRQSSASNTLYSNNYAGATWIQENGTFTIVTATIEVPFLWGEDGSVMAWIGMDSDGLTQCGESGVSLRAGIGCSITNGNTSCYAWCQWYPDGYYISYVAINATDAVTFNIFLDSSTSGQVYIQNQKNGQSDWEEITSSHALCEANVAWMVSEAMPIANSSLNRLANFSDVLFSSASASNFDDTVFLPEGSTYLLDIVQNNTNLTYVSVSGSTLIVGHV